RLEIDLLSKFGSRRPVRIALVGGTVVTTSGERIESMAACAAGEPLRFSITADATRQRFSITLNEQTVLADAEFAEPANALHRITFRTGLYRAIGGAHPVDPALDRPCDPAVYSISEVRVAAR